MLKEEFSLLSTDTISLSPNPLVQALRKPPKEFTKADIIGYIEDNRIPMLNLRYVGGDGRLKTLNFAIQSKAHLDRVLTLGERVDGSSLFTFVDATSSDLYVVPRLSTAFLSPFSTIPTLEFLCAFYDVDGAPLASAPQEILRKAQRALQEDTGCTLEALGELEYYLFSPEEPLFRVEAQRGYHESGPFSKWEDVRTETLLHLVSMGCAVKYAHSADAVQYVATRWPESVRVSPLTRARLFFTLRRHRDTPARLPRVVERVLTERAKHGASGADGVADGE